MKNLLVIAATVLCSSAALALGPDSSWREIFHTKNAHIEHAHQDQLGGLKLYNACVTDSRVNSVRDVKVCKEFTRVTRGTQNDGEGGQYTEYVCSKWGTAAISKTRTYTQTVCTETSGEGEANSECVAWADRTQTVPATIAVHVWEERGEGNSHPGFVKEFTFPACSAQ